MIDEKIKNTPDIYSILKRQDNISRIVTFVNPFSYYMVRNHEHLNEIDYIYIDGILLVKLFNFFNKTKIKRCSFDFTSLANNVFAYAAENKLKISMIGGKDYEIEKAVFNIKEKTPGLDIIYFHSGYFVSNIERQKVIDKVVSDSDILICGMGTPYQEDFAIEVKKRRPDLLTFTCGGFITQTSTRPDFYFKWIKKFNLMWLQRIIMFKHVRKRFFCDYPKFVFKYLWENFSFRF